MNLVEKYKMKIRYNDAEIGHISASYNIATGATKMNCVLYESDEIKVELDRDQNQDQDTQKYTADYFNKKWIEWTESLRK